jgi:hypothetical protein
MDPDYITSCKNKKERLARIHTPCLYVSVANWNNLWGCMPAWLVIIYFNIAYLLTVIFLVW